MEKELAPSSSKSDVLLSKSRIVDEEEEEEEEDNIEHLKDPKPEKCRRWSSRFKCYEAYACCLSSYWTLQINCRILNGYGILAFIPLILFRVLVGIPASIILIMLGRYIMTNLSKSWSMHVMAKGILICEILTTCYCILYSLIATSYLMEYMFLSLSMPWKKCNSNWATISCYEILKFRNFFAKCLQHNSREFCKDLNWRLSGEEYWKYVISNPNNLTSIVLLSVFAFAVTVTLFVVVVKGVQSAEKSFRLFVIIPLIMTPLMACMICMTPEFADALRNIFQINMNSLLEIEVWVISYNATLFILCVGRLPLAFVSSHAKFEDDIFTEILVICLTDIFFCILITMPTSLIIEVMLGRDLKSSYLSDSLDVFISISEMVILFPNPNHILASLYYLLLVLFTVGSLIVSMLALAETITGFAPDRFSYFYTSLTLCGLFFVGAFFFFFLGFDFNILIGNSIVSILFLYLVTLEVFYDFQMFADDYHFMMGYPLPFFLKFAWIISLPISIAMIVLHIITYRSSSSNTLIYLFLGFPFLIYILSAAVQIGMKIYKTRTLKQLSQLCLPEPDWGPADPLYKESRFLFDSRAVTKEFIYRQELQEKLFLKPPDISEQSIVHVV